MKRNNKTAIDNITDCFDSGKSHYSEEQYIKFRWYCHRITIGYLLLKIQKDEIHYTMSRAQYISVYTQCLTSVTRAKLKEKMTFPA